MRNRTNELATHQARISRAYATPMAGGATAVTIPSLNAMKGLASATEMANRKLAVQSEVLHGLGQKVQDWGKNTQWAGRQMMVGMTVPFVMGAAAAGMYANKIDAAMVRVEKVVNDNLDGFRGRAMDTAKEITNTMGQTIESSLGVMAELAAAGFEGTMLQSMTKLSQKLATLGDMDQDAAIKGMISIQQIYKLSTDELAQSVDYLNSVEDQTPTKLQDLVDAIPIAGVQVAQLGGTLQDTTILLTAFRERGIETVEGANAIKTAMNRILSPTAGAQAVFKELTGKDLPALVKATEGKPLETFQALSDVIMGGNIQLSDQQRIISKLVGTYQSSRITALMSGLQDKTGAVALTRGISEQGPEQWAARTAKSMRAITESASGQWRIAIESFKSEFIETGDMILKIATGIVQAATKVFGFFNDMPDIVKYFLLGGAGIMALAGPVTMIVGILGNFIGTMTKVFAVITGARSKYKSMSIEEKAAELAAGTLNNKMISQADTAQVLIYQMDKLRAAYVSTSAAANQTAVAMNIPNGGVWSAMGPYAQGKNPGLTMPMGGLNIPQVGAGAPLLGTSAWSAQTNQLLATAGQNMTTVAQQTQKAGKFQKVFNTETLVGVGAVTALAGLVTDTGSGLSDWLNWISLGAVALGGLLPIVTSIGQKIKTWASAQAAASLAGSFGNAAKGFGSKLLSGGKTALSGLSSFIMGPWGLAIGGALVAIWGVTKLISAAQEEQDRHQQSMVDSTDSWMKLLNKSKVEWGQIRDESGEVKDNIDSIVKKMREEMPDLVGEFSNAGPRYLEILSEREALKLEGQGLNKEEILNSLDALLQAAGRSRSEIDKVLGHIQVRFDFSNGEKDLKQFIDTTKKDLSSELDRWMFEMPASPDDYGPERSAQQDQTANRIAGLFYDRLAGLDPAQRALFAQNWASDLNKGFEDAFEKLEKDYGKDIGKNWADAKAKLFNWDPDDNKWVADRDAIKAAGLKVNGKEIDQMEIMIDTEQRLTQAIAKTLGISEDKYQSMSIISDVMPYVADGNITAAQAQDAYNKAIKEAKKNGKELTDQEKLKLAQLLASQFGLDAATLANNGYAKSNKKSADAIKDNAYAMQTFIAQMNGFAGAADDYWSATTQGEGGFADALTGDPLQQAQTLTDQVKGIYSGAMNDIYSAMADQAAEQWEARLNAITQSFENRREALQNQVESLDKSWDQRMEDTTDAYERRKKAIEDESDAQTEAIDNQIEALQEQEDARQRQFEAEKKRIERLAELANRSTDYNRALASGDLDEAARVMNNTESVTVGWNIEDARDASSLLSKDQVDQLGATKELVQKQKQARLDALAEEEAAVKKSMEMQRDIEKQRLQNRLDSLSQEQSAAEEHERKKQAMDRRTLEIELATLKTFIPQNEAELAAHVARISSAYGAYGLNLQTSGGYWGTIIGNALTNNVNRARQEMSNGAQWAAFGSSVAGAIAQGAFGLSLGDFFNLIMTGQPPANWTPPGWKPPSNMIMNPMGSYSPRHGGGMVDGSFGSRNGRGASPIGDDEVPTLLQRGEFVFPRSAVSLYGSEYLSKLAAGTPPMQQSGVGMAGLGGSIAAVMGRTLIGLAMQSMLTYASGLQGAVDGGTGAAVDFAKAQDGKPYIWGSSGPTGYDCSGYMSAIANVLTGKDSPYKRVFSTGTVKPGVPFGPFVPGLGGAFSIGVKNGNPGHTAGTLLGVPVESTGDHVRYGKDAHAANDRQFKMFFHIPDELLAAGAAIPGFGPGGHEPASDQVQQRVKDVAARYGWAGGEQWTALYNLIQGESSWNPNAANPTSSARGLFQKLTKLHGPLESTIEGQAQWGLNYIKDKYGNPVSAYGKWMSRSPHWYDTGGDVDPGLSYIFNGTNKKESLITHGRTGQLIDALEVANITYRGLQTQVKSLTPALSGSVAGGTGSTYNDIRIEGITIQGTNLNEKQLERAIRNGIEDAKVKDLKKKGMIK